MWYFKNIKVTELKIYLPFSATLTIVNVIIVVALWRLLTEMSFVSRHQRIVSLRKVLVIHLSR